MSSPRLSNAAKREKAFPLIFASLVSVIFALLVYRFRYHPAENDIKSVLSACIDFGSITVGFLVTSLSILPTLQESKAIQGLKSNHNAYGSLIDYIYSAIQLFLLLVVVSIFCLLVDFGTPQYWHYWISVAWVFLFFWSISSFYRAIQLFLRVLRQS